MTVDEQVLYEQGSKTCQQYSDLTMRIRTIAQSVQIAYAVGIALVLVRATEPLSLVRVGSVLIAMGVVAVAFAKVLVTLNRHYSEAFDAIRDESLVPLERTFTAERDELTGPWEAHQAHRRATEVHKSRAWHQPFTVLRLLGWAGASVGLLFIVLALLSGELGGAAAAGG